MLTIAAYGHYETLLEQTENLRLQRDIQLTHFIKQNRPTVGRPEITLSALSGPRKGAFLVPEQFTLSQTARYRSTIHTDERVIATFAIPRMDQLCNTLLASP